MSITLSVEPTTYPKTWEKFTAEAVPFSIALDGYVADGPRFDDSGPYANFNHHEGCNRMATHATCGQILIAIRQGLFKRFAKDGAPYANVFVNDCDEDVCLSWFLLKHHQLVESTMNPVVNRLVHMEDMLDATAGAYPFPSDLPSLRQLAWVFEPYRRARLNGDLDRKDEGVYFSIITDVEHRIMSVIMGSGSEIALDTRYEEIYRGKEWAMVKEIGAQARTGMFANGIMAYVAARQRPDGNYTYVIGKMSQFIPFNVPEILKALDAAEISETGHSGWGGGDTIGGSPRVQGSVLTPDEVADIVKAME